MVYRAAGWLVAVAFCLGCNGKDSPSAQADLSMMYDVVYRAADLLVAVAWLSSALAAMPNNPSAQSTSSCDAGLGVQSC